MSLRVLVALGLAFGVAAAVNPLLALAGLLAVGAAVVGVAHPPVLVAGMFLGMLFDRAGLTDFKLDAFPITASKLSVLGSLGLWGVHVGLYRARPLRWHPVLSAMIGMIVATAVCIAWANSMKEGKFDLFGLAMMTVLVALVYVVLAEADLRPLTRFVAVCLCVAILVSVARAGGEGEAGRASGTMGDPNEWATIVLLLCGLVVGGLAWDDHAVARPLRMGVMLLAPLAILGSESRTALVVSAIVLPACAYLLRHRLGELAACAVLGTIALPFALDLDRALDRFRVLVLRAQGGPADSSLEERAELFRQATALFADHWFIGAGPGNFAVATGFVSREGTLRPAHNTYLEIASEQGLVGLVPTAIFGATVAWTLWRGLREAPTPEGRARIAGVGLGLGAVALMAATLGLLTFAMAWLVLGFGLAVVYQAGRGRGG